MSRLIGSQLFNACEQGEGGRGSALMGSQEAERRAAGRGGGQH